MPRISIRNFRSSEFLAEITEKIANRTYNVFKNQLSRRILKFSPIKIVHNVCTPFENMQLVQIDLKRFKTILRHLISIENRMPIPIFAWELTRPKL